VILEVRPVQPVGTSTEDPQFEHMTFVYTEWDPITTNFATQNDTYTGIFLLKEDDEMVPFIDDPVATL